MTLYERHKTEFDRFAAQGRPNIAKMARYFEDHQDMSEALGYERSTAGRWIRGHNNISQKSDRLARDWLQANARPQPETPPTQPAPDGTMFMLICPAGTEDKARKLMALLGCELVEV